MPAARARKKRAETGFLDPSVWIRQGQIALALEGVDAVRVEPLAKALNVTKGSFYWHFKDRNALLEAILSDWRRGAVLGVIRRVERAEETSMERLRRLIEFPISGQASPRGASVELAIRHWAKSSNTARSAVQEVDEHRLEYIASLIAQGAAPTAEIRAHAFLVYSFMLAEAFVFGAITPAVADECEKMLLAGVSRGRAQLRIAARKTPAASKSAARRK